jgi:hypothetical protein
MMLRRQREVALTCFFGGVTYTSLCLPFKYDLGAALVPFNIGALK